MRPLVRSSLGLIGLSMIVPATAQAQSPTASAPAGYAQVAAPGPDGQPVAKPAPADAPKKHRLFGPKHVHTHTQSAQQAPGMMPPGQIVGCAHSKNGVCTACAALLALPGTVTVGSPAPAVAANAPVRPSPGVAVAYDASGMAEPTPIGVVRTNFAQGGQGMPMQAPAGMAVASAPGRAVASSAPDAGAGPAPYQPKSGAFPHPHVIGHLLGFSGMGTERREEAADRKKAAHASIHYNNEGTTVNDLPASMVYGKGK